MNCEQIQEFISKAADGGALDWEREAIASHVPGCATCVEFRDAVAPLGALVRAPILAEVERADFSRLWSSVSKGMNEVDRAARERARESSGAFAFRAIFSRAVAIGALAGLLAFAVLGAGES